MIETFKDPIYITRPLLPSLDDVNIKLKEIWESKWLTNMGVQHKELEAKLKNYLEVDNLVLFNNGTSALVLGIKALKLTGEVITTPFTFPATVQALDWNGLTPVFCDIDPEMLNIDPSKIEKLITEKTSAILAVHVFGNPCDVNKIQEIADKHNLKVIYDAAHAFGTKIDGAPIASFGDITMFSFHATKLFHTVEGGALVVKNAKLAKSLNLLKNFGISGPEEVVLSGTNAKLNEVQAAIGLEVLKIIEIERKKREKLKQIYESSLKDIPGISFVSKFSADQNSFQYFVIRIDEQIYGKSRNWVHDELKKFNVFTRKYFYPLCSSFPWYNALDSVKPANLPTANRLVLQVLSLPFYGELQIESVEKICEIIQHLYQKTI